MVEINTRIFGKIAIEEEKIIRFESGILGFPQLKDFTLIYNAEKAPVHTGTGICNARYES